MLEVAKTKTQAIPFVEGDALHLPFADRSFDLVTIGFGLRNFVSRERGLQELQRVLKPNGWVAILEFSQPTVLGLRHFVAFYYARLLPRIGGWVSGSRNAYEYLPDSISKFPNQEELAAMMRETGFVNVEFENLTGGVAALHLGERVA
jgi:demethylmenaquinone methyltransferase/2-methoxy-6-polyprenyl-1,4-benzoquinol methylase